MGVCTTHPKGDSSLPSVLAFYQEQSEKGAVWKVVNGFVAENEDSSVVKAEEDMAEGNAVGENLIEDGSEVDDSA